MAQMLGRTPRNGPLPVPVADRDDTHPDHNAYTVAPPRSRDAGRRLPCLEARGRNQATKLGQLGSLPHSSAQEAEAAGVESIWTVEHVVIPKGHGSRHPYAKAAELASIGVTRMIVPPMAPDQLAHLR